MVLSHLIRKLGQTSIAFFLFITLTDPVSAAPVSSSDQEFKSWAQSHASSKPSKEEHARGLALAKKRKQELLELIKTNPKKALESKIPHSLRKSLSSEIQAELESQVSGYGTLSATVATSADGKTAPVVKHFATINGKTFEASVYGRRSRQVSSKLIPLHGIAIGRNLAIHEDAVRPIEPGELNLPDPAQATCPVSQQNSTVNNTPIPVDVGGEVVYLCSGGHIMALNQSLAGQESVTAASLAGGTTGVKKVLYIRANFPDDQAEPITAGDADTAMAAINQFFKDCSYGKTSMTWTITPLVTLPQTKSWYGSATNGDTQLLADARAAAKAAGYDTAQYELDCVRYASLWGFSGMGYVGGKGV